MKDREYVRYLEDAVLSAMADKEPGDKISKHDEPNVSYTVRDIRERIRQQDRMRMERMLREAESIADVAEERAMMRAEDAPPAWLENLWRWAGLP